MEEFINTMNWSLLEKYSILNKTEIRDLERLITVDPGAAIGKMRKIIESLIKTHYDAYKNANSTVNLAQMIKELDEIKVYPRPIKTYLDTIRILGNIGAHEGGLTDQDVHILQPMFVYTAKWLITHSLELLVQKMKKIR